MDTIKTIRGASKVSFRGRNLHVKITKVEAIRLWESGDVSAQILPSEVILSEWSWPTTKDLRP